MAIKQKKCEQCSDSGIDKVNVPGALCWSCKKIVYPKRI